MVEVKLSGINESFKMHLLNKSFKPLLHCSQFIGGIYSDYY